MINVHFTLLSFGRVFFEHTKHFFHTTKQLTQHKWFEAQLSYFGVQELLQFSLDTHWWGRDHAGISLTISFLGFLVDLNIHDSRHWDWETGTWEVPGKDEDDSPRMD